MKYLPVGKVCLILCKFLFGAHTSLSLYLGTSIPTRLKLIIVYESYGVCCCCCCFVALLFLLQVNWLKAIYNLVFTKQRINVLVVRVALVIDYCH